MHVRRGKPMTQSGYEYDYGGETIQVAVHCGGDAREPRVRWQIGDQRGDYGYVSLQSAEPVVRLERGETVRFEGQEVSGIPIPQEIGQKLRAEYEEQGTVVVRGDRIATDPAGFPAEIAGFDRVGWESDRNVMWYSRERQSSPRAYQIEHGELVFRAQEWVGERLSDQELIDRYDLTVTF